MGEPPVIPSGNAQFSDQLRRHTLELLRLRAGVRFAASQLLRKNEMRIRHSRGYLRDALRLLVGRAGSTHGLA
jgi:hypothetical protein